MEIDEFHWFACADVNLDEGAATVVAAGWVEIVAGDTEACGVIDEGGMTSLWTFFPFPLFFILAPLSVGGFAGAIKEDA